MIVSAILYVDDTNMYVYGKKGEVLANILSWAQRLALVWCDALWATGCAVRPEKCWWYFVSLQWKGSVWRYSTVDESPGNLTVPDYEGVQTLVTRVPAHQSMRTLGVRIAADGNMKGELKYLIERSCEWADNLSKAYLHRSEAALALLTTISRTWAYPLPCTSFSYEECEKIMLPVYKVILPKMGVIRSIASIFRYAPKHLNGLGLPHIFVEQGCSQLKTLISHLNTDTKLGKSMCAQLEACSIEIGSTNFLFNLDFAAWSMLLTNCWMKNVWRFTDKYSW